MSEQLLNTILEEVRGISRRMDGLETRFDGLELRFEGLETRFDGLELRFEGMETRFGGLETGFDKLERTAEKMKLAVLETHWLVNDYGEELDRLNGRIDLIANEQQRQEKIIGALATKWMEHEQDIRELKLTGQR